MGIMKFLGDVAKNKMTLPTLLTGGPAAALAALKPKETAEFAGDMVKNFGKAAVQLTAQNPAIAEVAGKFGGEEAKGKVLKPREIPLIGKVKPLSANPADIERYEAQTPGETAVQAGNMFLEAGAPGTGRLAKGIFNSAKKVLPSVEKTASVLSSTPQRVFEKASNPEIAQAVKDIRAMEITGSPEDMASLGQEAFTAAQKVRKQAMETYKKTKDAIISEKQGKIIQRSKEFISNVDDVLKANKIKQVEGGLDLVGSAFEGSGSAQSFLQRAQGLMTRPIAEGGEAVDDLLTRREALTSLIDEIPVNEKNLLRVVKDMRKGFDSTLENVLGKEATQLREAYAKSIQPTESVIKSMTSNGSFSPDKARSFMDQAMSDVKFDKRKMLTELDGIAGTGFTKTLETLGVEKAINRLDPPTAGRVLDIVKGLAPNFVKAFFSPKFWGEIALRKGLKSSSKKILESEKEAKKFTLWFLGNALTMPVREASTNLAEQSAEDSFESQFGAEQAGDAALDLQEDNLSDEDFNALFGAEPVQ